MTKNPTFEIALVVDAWTCEECSKVYTEDDDINEPLYECAEGHVYSRRETGSHQCPTCNLFGAKIEDVSCPEEHTEPMESIMALQVEGWELYVPLSAVQEDS